MEVNFTDELFETLLRLGVKSMIIEDEKSKPFIDYVKSVSVEPIVTIKIPVTSKTDYKHRCKIYGVDVIIK